MLQWPAQLLAHTFGRTPAQGAEVAAFAATSPALSPDKPVPLFLHDCKPKEPSVRAAVCHSVCVQPHSACMQGRHVAHRCARTLIFVIRCLTGAGTRQAAGSRPVDRKLQGSGLDGRVTAAVTEHACGLMLTALRAALQRAVCPC
jgi:hypothetical protein